MQIDHAEMVAALVKDGAVIKEEMTASQAHLFHMAVGIAGEAGELLMAVGEHVIAGNELDRENVKEEMGDIEFYLEGLRQEIDVTRDHVILSMGGSALIDDMELTIMNLSVVLTYQATELLDLVKKYAIYQKELDRDLVINRLGNIEILMSFLRAEFDLTRIDIINANIEKLGVRYKGFKYTNEAAINRADKQDV